MTKNLTRHYYKNWVLVCVSIILAGYFFIKAPEVIPTHFDLAGNADNYGPKINLFKFPALLAGLNLLVEVLKRIDPKRENYRRFEKHFYLIIFAMNIYLLSSQIIIGAYGLNWLNQIPSYLEGSLGLLFIVLGNYMPKIKFNYFMGIRTPWTLADEKVWYLTHRLAGKIFVVMGILILLTVFLPLTIKEWSIPLITLGGTMSVVGASYWLYRKQHL
ncbi:SdpI family protein [Facklamia sp. P13055]|uniref:SdpI family protein n=1 Tax=Facklamia sp. P13055 TaxID=3421952 RepID=UPI003D17CC87